MDDTFQIQFIQTSFPLIVNKFSPRAFLYYNNKKKKKKEKGGKCIFSKCSLNSIVYNFVFFHKEINIRVSSTSRIANRKNSLRINIVYIFWDNILAEKLPPNAKGRNDSNVPISSLFLPLIRPVFHIVCQQGGSSSMWKCDHLESASTYNSALSMAADSRP